ncbi:hypothetical protein CAY62_10885 [Photobacterium damselae subsp. damselae]|nr:hypothetical protein CAY62_10885 [Photobacterium damselae subsp. damselae]
MIQYLHTITIKIDGKKIIDKKSKEKVISHYQTRKNLIIKRQLRKEVKIKQHICSNHYLHNAIFNDKY